MSIIFTMSYGYAAEDLTPTLNYIQGTNEGVYNFYGDNFLFDPYLVHILINDQQIKNSNIIFSKGVPSIKYFHKNAGDFSLEFMKTEYISDGIQGYVSDKKTDSIKIRKNTTIGWDTKIIREIKGNQNIITLPFIKKISPDLLLGPDSIKSDRKLIINGTEEPLADFTGEYIDGIYYITTTWVTFIEKNLTEQTNTIGLSIDGLFSNYMIITNEWITLDSPSRIEIEEIGGKRNLKMFFSEPRNFHSLTNKAISINGTDIDMTQATIGLGQFIIRYDISALPKDQDTLYITLRDTNTNTYSNKLVVNVAKYSTSQITHIDTGDGTSNHFTFAIQGTPMTFFGNMYKLKININGVEYTRDGLKEPILDANGVVEKDIYDNDKFTIKNKIEIIKTWNGIEFDFPYNLLKDGENILFINNDNTLRESNKVSFIAHSQKSINYNYSSTTEWIDNTKNEGIVFNLGKDLDIKVNPTIMSPTDRNILLGNLQLSNLKNQNYYYLDFIIHTNLPINPFSHMMLADRNLEPFMDNNSVSFRFKKEGYGADFNTDMELLAIINELYNVSDVPFILNIQEINLKKLNTDNIYESVTSLKNPFGWNISYAYTDEACFDGVKDFCSLIHKADPLLTINYRASGNPVVVSSKAPVIEWTNTGNALVPLVRRNITTIISQDFANERFNKAQDTLVKLYETLKKRNSMYVPAFRNATNSLLVALKNIELKDQILENITKIKSALQTLNEVLRKARTEQWI